MILSFKKTFPWKAPTYFKEKILDGTKIHTIRHDPHNRWKVGNSIQCAYYGPKMKYECFYEDFCKSVLPIKIEYFNDEGTLPKIWLDHKLLNYDEVQELTLNDGFDTTVDFFKWFNNDFKGVLINWTYDIL